MVFSLMMVFFLVGTGKMLTTNELLAWVLFYVPL